MSTQPENSEAPAPAAEDLVKRLKAAANDVVLLREIVESSDSASIAAAFAMLLKDGSGPAAPPANTNHMRLPDPPHWKPGGQRNRRI